MDSVISQIQSSVGFCPLCLSCRWRLSSPIGGLAALAEWVGEILWPLVGTQWDALGPLVFKGYWLQSLLRSAAVASLYQPSTPRPAPHSVSFVFQPGDLFSLIGPFFALLHLGCGVGLSQALSMVTPRALLENLLHWAFKHRNHSYTEGNRGSVWAEHWDGAWGRAWGGCGAGLRRPASSTRYCLPFSHFSTLHSHPKRFLMSCLPSGEYFFSQTIIYG